MADSFFGKLYKRAKSTERRVIEDFVTEVLARAIHDDHRPLLSVLQDKHLVDCNDSVEGVQAFPQVTIDRAGRIDLLLHIWQKSRRLEGWVEVKVNSPESGNQLANYVAYIRSLPTETRPFLVTLSKEPLNSQVTPITWQALWTASLDSPSAYWRDLRSFLEELEMADQFNAPIDQHEIVGLLGSHVVLRKAMHILQPVAEHVNAVWPAEKLPTKRDKILQMAASQFVYSRFTIYTNVYHVFLVLGVRATKANTELAIWLEPDNCRSLARRTPLIQRADESGLPSVWQRIHDLNVWETLLAKRLIKPDRPLVEHSQWLNERVDELSKAGIFDLIPLL